MSYRVDVIQIMYLRRLEIATERFQIAQRIVFSKGVPFTSRLKRRVSYHIPQHYQGADKSLARPGRKQSRKYIRDTRDFNNIETRAVIRSFFFLQEGKTPKEIYSILTETLACFLSDPAKDLSAPFYILCLNGFIPFRVQRANSTSAQLWVCETSPH